MTLEYGDVAPEGVAGRTRLGTREIEIFMRNNANSTEAVSTMVHESSHLTRYARGNQVATVMDEYRAFRREFLFTEHRRPTLQERSDIRLQAQQNYPHYQVGE